jgi:hypothetical protein
VPAAGAFRHLTTERSRGSSFSTHEITRASARLSPALTRPARSSVFSVGVFS